MRLFLDTNAQFKHVYEFKCISLTFSALLELAKTYRVHSLLTQI